MQKHPTTLGTQLQEFRITGKNQTQSSLLLSSATYSSQRGWNGTEEPPTEEVLCTQQHKELFSLKHKF